MAGGVLLLAANAGGTSYAADVLPGFLLVGAGVGPMFVAIAVAAMGDVPAERSGLASGLMMTGHEIGAALGVAALTAVAGDLATTSGLVDGYGRAFVVTAAALAGLFLLTLLAVPGGKPAVAAGHAAGHGVATGTDRSGRNPAISPARARPLRTESWSCANRTHNRRSSHAVRHAPHLHRLDDLHRHRDDLRPLPSRGTEEISAVDGVESVDVDLASGTVTVTTAGPVDRADIAAAVDEAGYALVP